jgi:hypothetical protein
MSNSAEKMYPDILGCFHASISGKGGLVPLNRSTKQESHIGNVVNSI